MKQPYMTKHSLDRFAERSSYPVVYANQRLADATEICPSVSGKYNNRDEARRYRYDDELIYIYDPISLAVTTVLVRDVGDKYDLMIQEFEA